jgi:ATP-dependent exoDNAse (exonuclease V) beta subunit
MDSRIGSKKAPRLRPSEPVQVDLKPYHHPGPIHRTPSSLTEFAAIEELNLEERLRGEFIHRVLYFVDSLDENIEPGLERIIKRVNDELKTDYPMETLKKNLLEFLNDEEIKPYFQAMTGRVTKKEQDFSGLRGNLFRMDRVVIDGESVSVIDYKTGTDKKAEKEYISQVKNYIRILKEIYPDKKVEGFIAYVDLKEIKRVK